MKKVILFLFLVCTFNAQSLFAQGNSASHQFVIVLPELATIKFQDQPNINRDNVVGVSLAYTGSVMQFDDFKKYRNLQIEVISKEGLKMDQYFVLSYQNPFDGTETPAAFQTISTENSFDLTLYPSHPEDKLQQSEINFSYKLIEESHEVNESGFFDVVYTLSDI